MTVTWLYCLLQCFIDIGAIFDRGLKVSDETIFLHKHLHLFWYNLSVTLWTIVLCGRGGRKGERVKERKKGGERKNEVGGMSERGSEHVYYFMIVLLSCWQYVTSHMASHDTPTSWVAVCHMTSHDTPTLLTSSMHGMCWPLGRNTDVSTDFFQTLAPSSVFLLVTSHMTTAADELRPNWGIRDRKGSWPGRNKTLLLRYVPNVQQSMGKPCS